ncbi:MAG: phage head closure protein [Flavobacteriales bacterium]|nr:phage head closure protein [Flavobacteriales bacterium]
MTFQSKAESVNAAGERALTWSTDFTTWAFKMELKGKEKFESSQLVDRADIMIKVRYRENIDEEGRFFIDRRGVNAFYDIYSITEIGRQEGLQIFGKLLKRT